MSGQRPVAEPTCVKVPPAVPSEWDLVFQWAQAGQAASHGPGPSGVKAPRGPAQRRALGAYGGVRCDHSHRSLSVTFSKTLVMSPEARFQADSPGVGDSMERAGAAGGTLGSSVPGDVSLTQGH